MIKIDINRICPVIKKRGKIDGVRGTDEARIAAPFGEDGLIKHADIRDPSYSHRASPARPAFYIAWS
jgi:hypothetical protein